MTEIFNTIIKADGSPLVALVNVQLVWDGSESSVAKVDGDNTMIRSSYGTSTDDNGYWSVELIANDQIEPSDSLYRVTERVGATGEPVVYYISVPSGATPSSVWVGNILEDVPSWAVS